MAVTASATVTSLLQENAAQRMVKEGDGEELEQQTASFTHACFCLSTHDGADLAGRLGEGM